METTTDKIKQDVKNFNDNKNLSDFDKSLILWIEENKPDVYMIFRSVSRSGMLRRFSSFIIKDNSVYYLNHIIGEVGNFKRDNDGYLKVYGCGMDMAFKIVSDFSQAIFNDYTALNYRLI